MISSSVGLKTHIWNNNLRCIFLLILYPLIIAAVAWAFFWLLGSMNSPQKTVQYYNISHIADNSNFAEPVSGSASIYNPDGMKRSFAYANAMLFAFFPSILTVVVVWFIVAWFFHTRMIRSLSHSHPVTRVDEPELYNLLENLCISRGVTMPKLEIIETHARNAFASGITESTYSITVTRGLMNSLAKDELEAVLAHELTHIINRDVRLLIVCVIFTGMFGFAAQFAWSLVRHNLHFVPMRRRDNNNNNGGAIIVFLMLAVILWLGYIATLFMRFSLSRRREFMADAGAIELTKNPEAMMRALMRIAGRDKLPQATDDIAMMCIENHVPFLGLFATHPPIAKRIEAISRFTGTAVPEVLSLGPAAPDSRLANMPAADNAGEQSAGRKNPWLIRQRRS